MLCKNDKIIDGNRQIFKLETDLNKAQKKCMRLALDIEELKMKYEPGVCIYRYRFNSRRKK